MPVALVMENRIICICHNRCFFLLIRNSVLFEIKNGEKNFFEFVRFFGNKTFESNFIVCGIADLFIWEMYKHEKNLKHEKKSRMCMYECLQNLLKKS